MTSIRCFVWSLTPSKDYEGYENEVQRRILGRGEGDMHGEL
jgi:hypothetical protein